MIRKGPITIGDQRETSVKLVMTLFTMPLIDRFTCGTPEYSL